MSIYRIGNGQAIASISAIPTYTAPAPALFVRWQLYWYHKSGGLKKLINDMQENSFLTNFSFERNQKGCGSTEINLAYIDFPIDADDVVKIYFKGTLYYSGIVEVTPDPKGGKISLIPLWQKTNERLYNGTFTTKTLFAMVKTTITSIWTANGMSDILWNDALVDLDNVTTYTRTYAYETAFKIIDDIVTKAGSRYWGVREDGYFFVKQDDAVVSSVLFYTDNPAYTDIDVSTDYSGIEATRYQVYGKQAGAGSTLLGQVGYGSSYPILGIETIFREKELKYTVPDTITSADALNYAYLRLQSFAAYKSIKVNHVNLDIYEPSIFKKITVQDHDDFMINTIIDCETISGWSANVSLDSTNYVEGSNSIKATLTNINDYLEYAFINQQFINQLQKIGFMVMSSVAVGIFLGVQIYYGYNYNINGAGEGTCGMGTCGSGDGTGTVSNETVFTNNFNITAVAVWQYQDFLVSLPITRIRFICLSAPSGATVINIDRIQFFQTYATIYTENITQINYDISPAEENVTMSLKTLDRQANRQLIALENKTNNIESIIVN